VFQVQTQSGGGYGDPLERDPERVLGDVLNGVVTVEGARLMSGVVIEGDSLDLDATGARREALRAGRRERSRPVGRVDGTGLEHVAAWEAASSNGAWS
jgi:N-methylhydantoinase B